MKRSELRRVSEKAGQSFDPVGDGEIRAAIRARIRENEPTARVVDEVEIGCSRIDVLSISDKLVGFEIKSWRDSLKKLERQARDYSAVVDYCALAATVRHMDAAMELVPSWWGLLLVSQTDDRAVEFSPLRPMEPNPAINVRLLARLLWREELRAILTAHGVEKGHASKAKLQLVEVVYRVAPLPEIRAAIVRTLRDRPEWRDDNGRAINRLTLGGAA